jgi:hypothetical protein
MRGSGGKNGGFSGASVYQCVSRKAFCSFLYIFEYNSLIVADEPREYPGKWRF